MAAHSELTPTEIADRLSLRELFDAYTCNALAAIGQQLHDQT
jgi:hypothetical protein